MADLPHDTSAHARATQVAVWQRLGAAGRPALAVEMREDVRALTRAGMGARHPEHAEGDVRWASLRLIPGPEPFAQVWPAAPSVAP